MLVSLLQHVLALRCGSDCSPGRSKGATRARSSAGEAGLQLVTTSWGGPSSLSPGLLQAETPAYYTSKREQTTLCRTAGRSFHSIYALSHKRVGVGRGEWVKEGKFSLGNCPYSPCSTNPSLGREDQPTLRFWVNISS